MVTASGALSLLRRQPSAVRSEGPPIAAGRQATSWSNLHRPPPTTPPTLPVLLMTRVGAPKEPSAAEGPSAQRKKAPVRRQLDSMRIHSWLEPAHSTAATTGPPTTTRLRSHVRYLAQHPPLGSYAFQGQGTCQLERPSFSGVFRRRQDGNGESATNFVTQPRRQTKIGS